MANPTESDSAPSWLLRFAGIVLAGLAGLSSLAILTIFLKLVPRFEEIFKKFDVPGGLPPLTMSIIAVGHMAPLLWVLLALALMGVFAMVYVSAYGKTRRAVIAAIIIAAVLTPALMIITGVVVNDLFAPLAKLTSQTGGPP